MKNTINIQSKKPELKMKENDRMIMEKNYLEKKA